MRKILELDGLRALAVSAVLANHLSYDHVGGYLGVDLFFVLSGYLITSLLLVELQQAGRISLRDFYTRRALRILPPLSAAIILALAFTPTTARAALATVGFYANFIPWPEMGALMHTWSLSIEEQFYLAWPLTFLLLGRFRVVGLLVVIAGATVARVVLVKAGTDPEEIYRWTFTRADAIAVGCLAAVLRLSAPGSAALPSLIAVLAVMLFVPKDSIVSGVGLTAFAVLCAVLIVSASWSQAAGLLLNARPMQWLGQRSYGVYLYHLPVLAATEPWRVHGHAYENWAWVTATRVVATLVIAEISYRTIEAAARLVRRNLDQAKSMHSFEPSPLARGTGSASPPAEMPSLPPS